MCDLECEVVGNHRAVAAIGSRVALYPFLILAPHRWPPPERWTHIAVVNIRIILDRTALPWGDGPGHPEHRAICRVRHRQRYARADRHDAVAPIRKPPSCARLSRTDQSRPAAPRSDNSSAGGKLSAYCNVLCEPVGKLIRACIFVVMPSDNRHELADKYPLIRGHIR
jgi:hypothetical protein